MKKIAEKRRHPRVKQRLPFEIGLSGVVILTETRNISCSGAYCSVDRVIPPMSRIKVAMAIPIIKKPQALCPKTFKKNVSAKKITCEGIVVRCEAPEKDGPPLGCNMAFMFTKIRRRDLNTISAYVNHQLTELTG